MKRFISILPALFAALLLVLSPAMTAYAGILPETKITIRQENEMGRKFDRMIRTQMGMVGDTYITDYVDKVVQNIVKAKRPMPFRVQSAVVSNPILNAFAIPGGYIYIFTGLLQEVQSEDQLAAVIAHELAHVSQRHVASRIEKQGKVGILSMAGILAGAFLGMAGGKGSGKAAAAIMAGSQGMATAAMLKYSREDENEADHVGLNSLVKAGYNPEGMPETFQIMIKKRWFDSGSQIPTYISTHPGLSERITYLHDRISRMPASFAERKEETVTLRHIQPIVRAKMSPADTALAYFNNLKPAERTAMDYVGMGIAQQRLKDLDGAAASFAKALSMDGSDPLVAREAGIFQFKTGNQKEAFKYLQMAVIKNRRDALGLFYLARLQAEAGQSARGAETMRKVLALVPEDSEVHHHLGMILGESGDEFGGNLHLAYAALYSNDMRKARYHEQGAEAKASTQAQKDELEKLKKTIQDRSKPDK
ncbi:M48 family metallopeptidase [Pseudodesulfovibrio cashew]|uniref:beta-barrel assembly-enhancing protease n=1 Tax=Pseudodesulfovibrio cashew TaxID=2678688 RepID=UPI001F54C1E6|nr:M48 family metallopeptidase [Pseudodesulfovibrio cashew]